MIAGATIMLDGVGAAVFFMTMRSVFRGAGGLGHVMTMLLSTSSHSKRRRYVGRGSSFCLREDDDANDGD